MTLKRILATTLVLTNFSVAFAQAAEADAFQAVLEESRTSGKGLTFYVNGQAIAGVVVSAGEKVIVARSTASGTLVIRRDRLDAVAGQVAAPADRK